MIYLQGGIISARNQRAELKVAQKDKIPAEVLILDEQERRLVRDNKNTIMRLASLSELKETSRTAGSSSGAALAVSADLDIRVIYEAKIDRGAEIAKIRKEIERLEKDVESKKKRLGDESFRSKAPAEIVRNLETTLIEREAEHQKLLARLKQLE
jgi:valyl-tRNA synthetase